MKNFIQLLVILGFSGHFAQAGVTQQIAASPGGRYTCAIAEKTVRCWGHIDDIAAIPTNLKNPTEIQAGPFHVCVVDDGAVRCWGNAKFAYQAINPPQGLKNPRGLSLGPTSSCVITDEGVRCWGNGKDWDHILTPPSDLRGVTSLTSSLYGSICAQNADLTIECWGEREALIPRLFSRAQRPPRAKIFNIGPAHMCGWFLADSVYKQDGFRCESDYGDVKPNVPPIDSAPAQIASGGDFICALTNSVVKCWNGSEDLDLAGVWNVPALNQPTAIAAGKFHVCALTADGVKCWGSNGAGELNVPPGL